METETDRSATYQWRLRAIGAFLDEQPSCRMVVAEVPDGFLVRTHRSPHTPEPRVLHVTHTAIAEQLGLMRQRKPRTRAFRPGLWARFPNGHQDFLRALGHELDEASAQTLLIDEIEEGIVLTYTSPEPTTRIRRKRLVVLGLPEIETILNAAFERRKRKAASRSGTERSAPAGEPV